MIMAHTYKDVANQRIILPIARRFLGANNGRLFYLVDPDGIKQSVGFTRYETNTYIDEVVGEFRCFIGNSLLFEDK